MSMLPIAMCLLLGAVAGTILARGSRAGVASARPEKATRAPLPTSRAPMSTGFPTRGGRVIPTASLWRLATRNPHCPLLRMFGERVLSTAGNSPDELPRCTRMDCDCRYEPVRDQRREPRRSGGDRREELRLDLADAGRRRHPDRRAANRTWAAHAIW